MIFKDHEGSKIDNKPFVGGWAKVKEHLGLYLSSNFLFSDKVLLVEGATDEIYIPLILQGLIERNKFSGDLNAFAIHSSLPIAEMIGYADIYMREGRRVAFLVDGDEEGKRKKTRIDSWKTKTNRECKVLTLSDLKPGQSSIEDFLEFAVLKEAVITACKAAVDQGVVQPKDADWEAKLRATLDKKDDTKSLGRKVEEAQVALFEDSIGDVWVARKYSELLRGENPVKGSDLNLYWENKLLRDLAKNIWTALELPMRGDTASIPLTTTS